MTTTILLGIIAFFLIGLVSGLSIGLWVDNKLNFNRKIHKDEPTTPTTFKTVPAFMDTDVPQEYRRKKQEEFFKNNK